MGQSRRAWNLWDVPYFGRPVRKGVPEVAPDEGEPAPALFLPLADGGARARERVLSILYGIGSVFAGAALTVLLLLASFVFSFGSPPDTAEVLVAILMGAAVAVCGAVLGVLSYRHASKPTGLTVHEDHVEIGYRTFKHPLVVPRTAVRAVAIDDAPIIPFDPNERFPIAGGLPEHVFADALDNVHAGPLGDLGGSSQGRTEPGVIWESPDARPGAYPHDDPARAGWGSGRRRNDPAFPVRKGYLWTGYGSSLPFLRNGALDAPNVALLFHEPIATPRPAWWFDLLPMISRCGLHRGGRKARGLLVRVRDARAAQEAFGSWDVVRQITAADVAEDGLLVAKPLAGWRAVAYAAVVGGPMLIELILRWRRH